MERHRFEPAAAISGLAAVTTGALVAGFGIDRLDPTFAIAAAAAALGLALIPWRGRPPHDPSGHRGMT